MKETAPAAPDRADGEAKPGTTFPAAATSPLAGAVLLALLCAAVFGRTVGYDFVNYDDNHYVYANPVVRGGLSLASVKWALLTQSVSNWHPLTWISHMADVSLFGVEPGWHHAVNLLFHGANSILLFLLLSAATGAAGRSLLVAALFAVHPLHVESVAWISERKDLLSTFFWLLATIAWLRYLRTPSARRYLAVVLLFVLALASKPMAVTFPLTLLLLDGWPLRRHRVVAPAHLVSEKMPLFALSAFSAVVTYWAQYRGGSVSPLEEIPLWARLANGAIGCWDYLGKTAWPSGLSFFYPHPGTSVSRPAAVAAFAALVATGFLLWRVRRERPWLAWGWLWYLVTLSPVIGVVQVGAQAVADRYTYVPLVGIFAALAWEGGDRLRASLGEERGRKAAVVASVAVVAALALVASGRVKAWKDGKTLLSAALATDPDNYLAHNNYGNILMEQGDAQGALRHFLDSLRVRPGHPVANFNVGAALMNMGMVDEAIPYFRKALEADPRNATIHFTLGNAWGAKGEWGHAAESYRDALAADPTRVDACINLGDVLMEMGNVEGAAGWYRKALSLAPGHEVAKRDLLRALALKEQKERTGR
jgi:tetratricopeptide (TPR) repeat protein